MLTRNDFAGVVKVAVAGLGFAPEIAMVTFPIDLFMVDSNLSLVEQNLDKFIDGLTKWQPQGKGRGRGILKPPRIIIEGQDYEDAVNEINALFLRKLWSDGLPLLAPTEQRVNWILGGTDLSPDTEIGKILPGGGIATVEGIAVSLAMAGGRPEYLPVLIAAVEAMVDPVIEHDKLQATSCSVYPVIMVNGPVARQIRLSSGFGLLGPDPQHHSGGCIGRAIRLLQQNVGGAVPGVTTMAMFGGMRYTNAVFAEDEEGLPTGWAPLNVEFGYSKGTNTVVLWPASGATNILRRGRGKETSEEEALESLYRIAAYMGSPNPNMLVGYDNGTPGILLISRAVARQLASLGWTKEKIRKFLWENSSIPLSEVKRTGLTVWIQHAGQTLKDPWPITNKPDNIILLVAGGAHTTHAYWMQAGSARRPSSREIRLPAKPKWDDLLKQAESDLEPIAIG